MKSIHMYKPFVSVIIPSYNEERYIGKLLKSLNNQSYKNYEVIVADAFSKDATRQIAMDFGAEVVEGGKPAKGRNVGAGVAKGDYFIFLDADVWVPKNFMATVVKVFEQEYYEVATVKFMPDSRLKIDKIMFQMANLIMDINKWYSPTAPGFAIVCTKRVFNRINGFDETLHLAEDHDFVKRAYKWGRFGIIKQTYMKVSVRRLEKEGRINLIKKYTLVEVKRILQGKIKDDSIEYEFGKFDKHDMSLIEAKLEKILRALEKYLNLKKSKK